MSALTERCRLFRELHRSGCFVIPNPWDLGSARLLAGLGFPALATTSSGFAWSLGRRDHGVSLEESLAHIRSISSGVAVPVIADFEGGFAVEPERVAAHVDLVASTARPESDRRLDRRSSRSPPRLSTRGGSDPGRARGDRPQRHRRPAHRADRGFIVGRPDLKEAIRRLAAYAEAAAECLFAAGIRTSEEIAAVVKAARPW
jgi:methylisocitrate lyase